MSYLKLETKGHSIADNDAHGGKLRDIEGVINELNEVLCGFSTSAVSEHALFLQGVKAGLSEVLEYLKRV